LDGVFFGFFIFVEGIVVSGVTTEIVVALRLLLGEDNAGFSAARPSTVGVRVLASESTTATAFIPVMLFECLFTLFTGRGLEK
jgi:hypothetical protein